MSFSFHVMRGTGQLASGSAVLGLFLGLFAVSAGAASATGPSEEPRPVVDLETMTAARWAKDLDLLATELPKLHKNLFFHLSEADFRKEVSGLKADLPSLNGDESLVGVLRIVASIGDSHTSLRYRSSRGLPLLLYWFKDGIRVLNTTGLYKDMLNCKVTKIGGRPIAEVAAVLAGVIPHENEAQVRDQVPSLLTDIAVLHGLELIPSAGSVPLTVETGPGRFLTVKMEPVPLDGKLDWLVDNTDETGVPLYLRNRKDFYWYEVLPDDKAVYFKYNSCGEMKDRPFAVFVKELFAAVDSSAAERIVVDLRHNGGGDSEVFRPFLEELAARPIFRPKGKIFVIVGRRTFSSAILNAFDLKKYGRAVFAGEPTGGKPNHYGELRSLELPESGLGVSYSTQYFQNVKDDPASIIPDIMVEPSFADYRAKTDPVLNAVLGRKS